MALANATIGPTAAKVTPIITGSLMPNQRVMPRLWISVTMPQANRSALISSATCSGVSFKARPTISGTAIARVRRPTPPPGRAVASRTTVSPLTVARLCASATQSPQM